MSDDKRYVITSAGMLWVELDRRGLVGTRQAERIRNAMVNEAMAARDIIKVDRVNHTLEIRGESYELEQYVRLVESTDIAIADAGISPERLRAVHPEASGDDQ